MKHFKKTLLPLTLLTLIIGSRTSAQDSSRTSAHHYFKFASAEEVMQQIRSKQREKEVVLDNEYKRTGYEQGVFLSNPLMLDGKPLEYSVFGVRSKGELTLAKATTITGQTIQIPFHVYLRRNGNKVFILSKVKPDSKQTKIKLSKVLEYAKPGDQLIIEPVNKEDGPAKRILKLFENGC